MAGTSSKVRCAMTPSLCSLTWILSFSASFADSQLTDALKHLASDPSTDAQVKKKLAAVLAGWRRQFSEDPSMQLVAKLYEQCRLAQSDRVSSDKRAMENVNAGLGLDMEYMERKKKEEEARKRREEEKRKAKEDKQRRKREEEERRQQSSQPKPKRKPFNFEQVHPMRVQTLRYTTNSCIGEATNLDRHCERISSHQQSSECDDSE